MTDLHIKVLGAGCKKYHESCEKTESVAVPDHEAIRFYTLNHLASFVKQNFTPNEPLPEWALKVMREYTTELKGQAERAFFYLLAITTREARHMYKAEGEFYTKAQAQFGTPFMEFCKNLPANEEMAVQMIESKAPDCSIGQYVSGLAYIFYKGKWASSYGGPKWGTVTDCLLHCVQGKTSMEMMLDTCYTLAHNGGPIFNKGMMYQHYSVNFIKILDIQRSGQMPELVMDKDKYGIAVPDGLDELVKSTKESMEAADLNHGLGAYVDWYKVVGLGSKGAYWDEKKKQDKKHPKKAEPMVFPNGIISNLVPKDEETWDNGMGDEYQVMERAKVTA